MIVFDKLWELMKAKGITQYALIVKYHVSPGQITRIKRNESISTHTVDMFCDILGCDVEDIMQHIPNQQPDTPLSKTTKNDL